MARPQGVTRPACPYCGKPLRKDVKYRYFSAGTEPTSLDECRRRFNAEVVSVRWGHGSRRMTADELAEHAKRYPAMSLPDGCTMTDEARPRVITSCNIWEGGFGSYGGFCTLRCAAEFGIASHRAGYRMKHDKAG